MTMGNRVPLFMSVGFGAFALLVVASESIGIFSIDFGFLALTAILLAYLFAQVMFLRIVHPQRWLLNPAVVCSWMTFFMGYGLCNILYILPAEYTEQYGIRESITPAMFKLMMLVMLGSIGMWTGYWSGVATALTSDRQKSKFNRFLQQSNQLHTEAVLVLIALSSGSRLIAINLGIYGYSSSYDRLIEMGAYTQYFALFGSLGKLALLVSAMNFYSNDSRAKGKNTFYIALVLEVLFGLLSGFKSAIVLPFIIAAVCQYMVTGKFSKSWVIYFVIGIFFAYQVIEPFRDARNSSNSFKGTSAIEIMDVLINAPNDLNKSTDNDGALGTAVSFLARTSMAQIGSYGVEFADINQKLPPGSPDFLVNIILAPLHAWIPRIIWPSKPEGTLGMWYTQEVMGYSEMFSSTAMGIFTYLNFAGGVVAVFAGFVFIGITQRIIFFLLRPFENFGGALVFFGILQTISVMPDGFNDVIIDLSRLLPMMVVLQLLIYKNENAKNSLAKSGFS